MFRAVITLTKPADDRRKTTNARRPSSVSPKATYRFSPVRLTLWSPAKTSSTSYGVNSCLSIWRMLSSSHSKLETTTGPSYQVVYTKRYKARGLNRYGDNSWAQRFPWGKPWDRQPISGKLRLKLVSVPGLRPIAARLPQNG